MYLSEIEKYFDKEVQSNGAVMMRIKNDHQWFINGARFAYYVIYPSGLVRVVSSDVLEHGFIDMESINEAINANVLINKIVIQIDYSSG